MTAHTRFIVVLEAPAGSDDARVIRTLRLVLKRLWRGSGLRCVAMQECEVNIEKRRL
jgi:hypothetical protein